MTLWYCRHETADRLRCVLVWHEFDWQDSIEWATTHKATLAREQLVAIARARSKVMAEVRQIAADSFAITEDDAAEMVCTPIPSMEPGAFWHLENIVFESSDPPAEPSERTTP